MFLKNNYPILATPAKYYKRNCVDIHEQNSVLLYDVDFGSKLKCERTDLTQTRSCLVFNLISNLFFWNVLGRNKTPETTEIKS